MNAGSFAVLTLTLLLAAATPTTAQQVQQPIYIPTPPPPPRPPGPPAAPAAMTVPDPLGPLLPAGPDLYRSPDGSDRFLVSAPYPRPRPPIFIPGRDRYRPWPYYLPGHTATYMQPLPPPPIARGGLTLETSPEAAQVYVDGFYVGLAQDFGVRGHRLELSEGAHDIDLRAFGYETLSFSVLIVANDLVRYRGDMHALAPPLPPRAQQAQQAGPQKSYYVVPYCYAGDKPPTRTLPSRCDMKKMQTQK